LGGAAAPPYREKRGKFGKGASRRILGLIFPDKAAS